MQPVSDPYRALGVPRGATEADIKAAHRRLAKRYHPDATGGDSKRFLKVQEAYRVLSDPLLRRDWDASHAGPVRADRPASPRPRRARAAPRRQADAATDPDADPGAQTGPGTAVREGTARETGTGRPRSSRAYTWTATEVPWWEEGTARQSRRRSNHAPNGAASTDDGSGRNPSDGGSAGEPGAVDGRPPEPIQDFDVYNRSSGAAWSAAARAYFRRGEQDLPRRGSFRHEGTQPLTAARARAASEAEARQRAAAARTQPAERGAARPESRAERAQRTPGPPPAGAAPAYAYARAGVARDPERVAHVRDEYMRRTRALQWPSLRQRFVYAFVAWLPLALLVGYGYTQYTGCSPSLSDCSQSLEPALLVAVGLLLVLLLVLPRIAYVGAMGTLVMILAAALATGVLVYMRASVPTTTAELLVLGVVMGIAYAATVLVVALRGGPWRWAAPR